MTKNQVVCFSCKHFANTGKWSCRAPQVGTDVVTGKSNPMECEEARKNPDLCGVSGTWYEPIPPGFMRALGAILKGLWASTGCGA